MKAFLILLLGMLRDFVTSKKVLTALLTSVAGALIKDAALRDRVVAIGLALLGAQAATDVGKAKAAITAAVAPGPVVLPAVHVPAFTIQPPPAPVPGSSSVTVTTAAPTATTP